MTRERLTIVYASAAARYVRHQRAWLHDHRGREWADAFENELAHFLDLLEVCPEMGNPTESGDKRHWYLRRSRMHVYYRVHREAGVIVIADLRHAAQRPPEG
jgi:plasmid stabilization system protein ParE